MPLAGGDVTRLTKERGVHGVRVDETGADIWAGVQDPLNARNTAAKALGLDSERVRVTNLSLGGGFGRRLTDEYAAEATQVSKAIGAPVKPMSPSAQTTPMRAVTKGMNIPCKVRKAR